jgi:PleD family two-component response regulator
MLTNFPSTNLLHETSAGERAEASASAAPSLDPALLGTQMTPLERLSALEENSAMGLNPPMKCRPRILVVDDDDFEFELLEDVFGAEYEVLFAKDGLAALQIAAEKRPDLILLDVMATRCAGG